MNLLMSDRPLSVPLAQEDRYIDLSALAIEPCIGCFGCWIKTPGRCVLGDDAVQVYPVIGKSDHVVYVTKVKYGCYDTVMKTMLERSIPIQQAFIRLAEGETHHVQRDVAPKQAVVIAYGTSSDEEQALFRRLVARNARNMNFEGHQVRFCDENAVEAAVVEEVAKWAKF